MISIPVLFSQVLTLMLMMIPGFLMAKFKLAPERFGKGIANLILYVAQPALIILAYNCDFSWEILYRAIFVFVFAIVAHVIFTVVALLSYKKSPEAVRRVLRFAMVFTNAGYMGIPLLEALYRDIDPNVGIYASIYVIVFNVFCWSVGSYLYSDDKKYMSPKKMFLNPAVVATAFGLVLFFTPLNQWLSGGTLAADIVLDIMFYLKNMVAPLSMLIIGIRLAEMNWKGAFRDKQMYPYLAVRMLLLPAALWGIMKLLMLVGLCDQISMTVILLSAAAPAATATVMFAELFDGDAVYAGKIVSISSILSIGTMPLVALLLLI